MTALRLRAGWLLGLLMALAAGAEAFAYWPGLMTWDARRQYDQALAGRFDDWHPPAMEALWRHLIPIHQGPAPMLLVQLGLYWLGFGLLVGWAWRLERRRLATALAVAALLPVPYALMGAVLKDCLMAAALLAATGMLAWAPAARRPWAWRTPALLLLLGAATLRFNALPAILPLAIALLPLGWRATWPRFAGVTLVCTVVIAAAVPVANALLGASKSGVARSLVIFDLGGITLHSGVSVFPEVDEVPNPVAENRRCYRPDKWDSYSWWVPDDCKLGFEPMSDVWDDPEGDDRSPIRDWGKAIAAHPLAYAEHRLTHFNINTRFLVHDDLRLARGEIERPVQDRSAPSPWGYHVTPNPALAWIDRAARWSAHTPLGWPIVWMMVALASLVLTSGLASARLAVPLALSSLLYGLGYLPSSVASELRYHFWTMSAAALAAILVVADGGLASASRRRRILALGPLGLVTALCVVWRVA